MAASAGPDGLDHLILTDDMTKAHKELNHKGEANQLYYIANLITRCFYTKTLLSPEKGIQAILCEYKRSILSGCRFYFNDFFLGEPP